MNKLSSLLNFIANTIGSTAMGTTATTLTGAIAEAFARTRSVYGKGTHTISRLYGVYGYMGTGNTLSLYIPINLASNVKSVSFSNLVATIRNVDGNYVYTTTADMSSLISNQNVATSQPVIIVRLVSSSFNAPVNTPVCGEITAATFALSDT